MRSLSCVTALTAIAALSCGGTLPCSGSKCPDIQGGYVVSWEASTLSSCSGVGPRPTTLNVTREGSTGQVTVDGALLKGSIYDTWDFSLHGSSATGSLTLRGRAAQPKVGGPWRLTGTFSLQKDACELVERFTADQT